MFINQDKSKQETERNPIIAAYLQKFSTSLFWFRMVCLSVLTRK